MQKLEFENWYDIALDAFNNAGFKGLPLDKDAAKDAYDEGISPEGYIQQLKDNWDSNHI